MTPGCNGEQMGSSSLLIHNFYMAGYVPLITRDGQNGAIIAYYINNPGGGVLGAHAQRINNSGVAQWQPGVNGVTVCAWADGLVSAVIADSQGGAIVAWTKSNNYIYAQRFDSNGSIQWTSGGVPVCSGHGCGGVVMASDNQGGAIFAWEDSRNGAGNVDIYAQKINASGTVDWIVNGVSVCNSPGVQIRPQIISDGQSGVIITWVDSNIIYAQRINSLGAIVSPWPMNGVVVYPGYIVNYAFPVITTDGQGGAIISWSDSRYGSMDIFAQRVDAQGSIAWPADGLRICGASGDQMSNNYSYKNAICSDGQYGAVIPWFDGRNDNTNPDIFAQHILPMKPAISSTYPDYLISGGIRSLSILGSYFSQATAVKLVKTGESDIYGMNMNKPNGGQIDANFDLTSAALGQWTVLAIDSSGQTSNADILITISNQTPTPTATPTATATQTVDVSWTQTPTPTATPIIATPTPSPASQTFAPITDFRGRLIDEKYFFVYPNPTRDVIVRFRFFLKQNADVKVAVYTLSGDKVWSHEQGYNQGWNEFTWNSTGVANGGYMYLVTASGGGARETLRKKLALLR